MTLLEEVEELFGTKDLYKVLSLDKNATPDEVKKGYRKTSLKVHPDRVGESEKDKATKRFQVLAQVHYILSDSERRKLYDDQGIIANDESLESEADWSEYWRLLFPKISEKDIQDFLNKYIGSEEEEKDLIEVYKRYKGDLDKISETLMGYDEERTSQLLKRLLDEERIPKYKNFTQEPSVKKRRREAKAKREAKEAEELKEELKSKTGKNVENLDDLTALIKNKSQGNFNSMIASLEAKYSKKSTRKRKSEK